MALRPRFSDERPLGMEAEDGGFPPGEEPGALGAGTFAEGQEARAETS
jgi:hypothetical protein